MQGINVTFSRIAIRGHTQMEVEGRFLYKKHLNFPGGPEVKNPPVNSGDTGSIPGPRRSHMPLNSQAYAPRLLNL